MDSIGVLAGLDNAGSGATAGGTVAYCRSNAPLTPVRAKTTDSSLNSASGDTRGLAVECIVRSPNNLVHRFGFLIVDSREFCNIQRLHHGWPNRLLLVGVMLNKF